MAFGRVEVNKQTISHGGWEPLNRMLLEHQHLLLQKSCDIAYPYKPSGLNVENAEGIAASVIDRIVRERVKNKAAKIAAEKQLANGHNIRRNIKDAKRVSAGILAKNGVFALANAEFIAGMKDHHDKEITIKAEKAMKKKMYLQTNAKKSI